MRSKCLLLTFLFVPFSASILTSCEREKRPPAPSAQKVLLTDTGKKLIALEPGTYQVWLFYVWKSKGIDTQVGDLPSVQILSPIGEKLKEEPVNEKTTETFQSGVDRDRRGLFKSIVTVQQRGNYEIVPSSKTKCVVTLVPTESLWTDLGSVTRFKGDTDDTGFVR